MTQHARHAALVPEAHLRLRRMHVHVDRFRGQVQRHARDRVAPARQLRLVGVAHREAQRRALYPAAVHEERDAGAVAPVQRGRPRQPRDCDVPLLVRHVEHRLPLLRPVDRRHRMPQIAVAARLEGPAPRLQAEGDSRVRERVVRDQSCDLPPLARRRPQETAPRRYLCEQLPHCDRCPHRRRPRAATHCLPVNQQHRHPHRLPLRPRHDLDLRRRCNRSQRLPPEAERGHAPEVPRPCDLAGRVSLEGHFDLVGRDAPPVVVHLHRPQSALDDGHADPLRARVDGVIQ